MYEVLPVLKAIGLNIRRGDGVTDLDIKYLNNSINFSQKVRDEIIKTAHAIQDFNKILHGNDVPNMIKSNRVVDTIYAEAYDLRNKPGPAEIEYLEDFANQQGLNTDVKDALIGRTCAVAYITKTFRLNK
jgi:hypothetical protein